MDGYKLMIFTGGSDAQRYYRGYGYDCDITQPKSCVLLVTDADSISILLEHGDQFTVRAGFPYLSNGATMAGEYS